MARYDVRKLRKLSSSEYIASRYTNTVLVADLRDEGMVSNRVERYAGRQALIPNKMFSDKGEIPRDSMERKVFLTLETIARMCSASEDRLPR